MTRQRFIQRTMACIAFYVFFSTASFANSQANQIQLDYTVAVASTDQQLFHVTTDIKNIREPELVLSLPTWTPGWYTVENYFKYVLRFKITDGKGNPVPSVMTRKQTWKVDTKGLDRIKVEFDYLANVLALNQAKITKDFAFFTGTQLFLEPKGYRKNSATVHFQVPAGWKIISTLKETSDPMVFTAADYDTLVDSPTEMGSFDLTRFDVLGKPHSLVVTPAGTLPKDQTAKFTEMLTKVVRAQSAIFGGLPYEKYIHFYFFAPPESNAGGALEHNNSFVAFGRTSGSTTPDNLIGTASHEFFHLWNVKRLRPAEMWPYDYSRDNETPLLWVSEGFTSYYGGLSLYRAGLRDKEWLFKEMGRVIMGVESNEARKYISPADSSTSTWIGYDSFIAFEVSYYTQGDNLGGLLDLSILHDTDGDFGLDEVMRSLYREFYERGKGFTTDDMIGVINRITKRDYRDFFRRYVWGVEVPPYETIYGYAGLKLEKASQAIPMIGIDMDTQADETVRITQVIQGMAAAQAGLAPGDVILAVNDKEVKRRFRLNAKPGETIKMTIRRGEEKKDFNVTVGSRNEPTYQITELPNATPGQMKVRAGWLKTSK